MKDLPEEEKMWKEKQASEETKDESDDPFIPARLAEPTKEEDILVRIIL
jgi:hypothetical protein